MSDRDEIQELMAHYAEAIDTKDYARLAACFAPDADGQWAAMPEPVVGSVAIANFMKGILDRLEATTHMFTNFIIEVNGDTARMQAKIIAQHVRMGVPGGETYLAGARYDAQVRRIDGKWKLARVRGSSIWHDGNAAILKP
jgi:uncharacterized protein (TIGR02246 family)